MLRIAFTLALLVLAAAVQAAGESRKDAILLVADEDLKDPNFERTVVLVTRAPSFEGPFGVILNRVTPIPLREAFPKEKSLEKVDDTLFIGGPVAVGRLIYIFRSATKPPEDAEDIVEVVEGVYLGWNPDRLAELLKRERPTEGLRVYAGHSAWAPGQLETEVARGSWKSARAEARSIFDSPGHLWPELHRRASLTTVRHSATGYCRACDTAVDGSQPPPSAFIRSTE